MHPTNLVKPFVTLACAGHSLKVIALAMEMTPNQLAFRRKAMERHYHLQWVALRDYPRLEKEIWHNVRARQNHDRRVEDAHEKWVAERLHLDEVAS